MDQRELTEEFTGWASGVERQLLRSAYLLTGDLHRAQDLVQRPRHRDGGAPRAGPAESRSARRGRAAPFDDLTERETAAVLGVAVGTVKSQNAAARLRSGATELLDRSFLRVSDLPDPGDGYATFDVAVDPAR